MDNFTNLPILNMALAQCPQTKPQFLSELRDALVRVGFFYLTNHQLPDDVQQEAMQQAGAFFALPMDTKLKVDRIHNRHFFGYSRSASEITEGEADYSEGFLTGSDALAPGPDQPVYLNLQGPSQWPDPQAAPGFREAMERYRSAMDRLSAEFAGLIEEALGLEPGSITKLFGTSQRNDLSLRKYLPPSPENEAEAEYRQGIGAHKDVSVVTYLLQQSQHNCLEVQNKQGAWISVPPRPGSLVVNIGRILEAMTAGICAATVHRVVLKSEGFVDTNGASLGPRLSIAFFQDVNLRLRLDDLSLEIPSHVAALRRGEKVVSSVEDWGEGLFDRTIGDSHFVDYLTGFPDVGERWYPEILPLAVNKLAGLQAV